MKRCNKVGVSSFDAMCIDVRDMLCKNKTLFVVLGVWWLLTLWALPIRAQLSDTLNNHIILAFDDALHPDYIKDLRSGEKVKKAIKKLINEGVNGKPLLASGDYYSFVNFVIGNENKDLNSFAKPAMGSTSYLAWKEFDTVDGILNGNGAWDDIVYTQGKRRCNGEHFSLLTGAKAYTLKSLYGANKGRYANKTYLIMVTDDHYNGNDDTNKEFEKLNNPHLSKDVFEANCRAVSQYYKIQHVKDVCISTLKADPYQAFLYEVVPSSPFSLSLSSVVNYPASFGMKRVKGGYRFAFNVESVSSDYKIQKMKLSVKRNDNLFEIDSLTNEVDENLLHSVPEHRLSVFVDSDKLSGDSVEVRLRGWILQNDSVYGGIVMNPYDPNFSRLTVVQHLPLSTDFKVLGLFPLIDELWWWFPNDLEYAVLLWNFILVLCLIIVVVWIIRWVIKSKAVYTPGNWEIKIKRF